MVGAAEDERLVGTQRVQQARQQPLLQALGSLRPALAGVHLGAWEGVMNEGAREGRCELKGRRAQLECGLQAPPPQQPAREQQQAQRAAAARTGVVECVHSVGERVRLRLQPGPVLPGVCHHNYVVHCEW